MINQRGALFRCLKQLFMPKRLAHRLYVGQLSPSTTQDQLKEFYSQFGTIEAFKPVHEVDRNRTLKYAFISFSSQQELEKAMCSQPHLVDGTPVWVFRMPESVQKRTSPKVDTSDLVKVKLTTSTATTPTAWAAPKYELYIRCLPSTTTDDDLYEYYRQFDEEVRCRTRDGEDRFFALISFSSKERLAVATRKRPHTINGFQLNEIHLSRVTNSYPIYVSRVAEEHTQEALHRHFSKFGFVLDCNIPEKPNGHLVRSGRRFAFVFFDTKEAMNLALDAETHLIGSEEVFVNKRFESKTDSNTEEAVDEGDLLSIEEKEEEHLRT